MGIDLLRTYPAKNCATILVRPAVETDAPALIQAIDSVSREGLYFLRSRFAVDEEVERSFIFQARQRGDLMLIASVDGRLVGWVTLFRVRAEFQQHIAELGMGVVEGCRELGVGTALMDSSLRWAEEHGIEKVTLRVRASNARARALYSKFGFVQEGYRVRDVRDPEGCYEDNVEMAWFASPSGGCQPVARMG